MAKVDLHSHTTKSDGRQTVSDLIKKAEEARVKVLAITDHDYMYPKGYAVKEAAEKGIRLLHGIELAFRWEGEVNEVLGYGVDRAKLESFFELVQKQKKSDETENLKLMHEHFAKIGFTLLPLKELLKKLDETNLRAGNIIFNDIYANPKNSQLVEKYSMEPSAGVYDRYLNNRSSPLHFRSVNTFPLPQEVSKALRESGALVFMAHPLHYRNPEAWGKAMLDYVVENKLIDGVEVWHPKHTPEQIEYLKAFAKKHKLLVSGGSDNHYLNKPLGVISDGTEVTDAQMLWLKGIKF